MRIDARRPVPATSSGTSDAGAASPSAMGGAPESRTGPDTEAEVDPSWLSDLSAEQAMVDHIRAVHAKHIETVRAHATRLAGEAAEATEDGIRDLVDEDAEADTAIRAAIVRQSANRAMQAFRRLTELESAGDAMAFGSITSDPEREVLYVGRLSVIDGDEALLVDWRARAAAPFYQATPVDRQGVTHRRHLNYGDGQTAAKTEIVGYSDEVFDLDSIERRAALRGEAAILASLEAPTETQMKSVVATIQAEQDRIIRAPSAGTLVVQGGPGTGKTVVALHRAAYLLYNQRAALAENGVLMVGPTNEFLAYISGVLPSLGETGVVSVTAKELYPGVLLGLPESAELAALKGRIEMASLLANAVRDRQRPPKQSLVAWYGSDRVRIPTARLEELFAIAQRFRTHNDGADALRTAIVDDLVQQVNDPSFANYDDAYRTFAASRHVRHFMLSHWPTLTPEQALNDVFGSPALLKLAARGTGLRRAEVEMLKRQRISEAVLADARWSEADVPLLDELLSLVGVVGENTDEERIRERDDETDFEIAAARAERGEFDDDLLSDDEVQDNFERTERTGTAAQEEADDELAGFTISKERTDYPLPTTGSVGAHKHE